MNPKLITTFILVSILVSLMTWLAAKIKEEKYDVFINLSILVLAGCLGWFLGIFMSPYDHTEQASFAGYATAFATFASGYLLAKVDPLITKLLTPEFIFKKIVAFRLISFFSILLLSMLMTFAVRVYLP